MDEKIDILLSRYFSGEATEEELQSLDRWLAQSPENEAYFEEMTTIFQHAGFAGPMPEPDTEKALPAFKNHCRVNNETIQKPESEKTRKREIASLSLISRFRVFAPHLSIAASILLIAGISLFFFKKTNNQVHIAASNTAVQQELFEGVFVSLEAGTEIAYNPENIQEVVLLKGEATFDVTSPRNGQLLVRVGETLIRDIGTVFTVTAHNPGESIMVTVTEGEVLFYAQNNAGIRIKQSGKGIFHPQKNFFEHIAPPAGIKAIEFDATPLPEVISILSAQYNTEIKTAADSLNNLQISVSFDPDESIEDILAIISETLSMRVTKNENGTFVLSY